MLLQRHDKPALIRKEQEISYTRLIARIHHYADLFQADECKKVALYAENRLEWVYAFYAGWKNGCIVVPIDFMATSDEVAYILEDCRPELLFCSQDKAEEARAALQSLSYTPKLMILDELEAQLQEQDAPQELDFPEPNPQDTAVIIYTSGTTGSPKGAMLSFENILSNTIAVAEKVPIFTAKQRVLVLLPLHHIFPLLGTMVMPLYSGGTIVFSPSMASEDILDTLQTHSITIILGVPRLYNLLRKGIRAKIDSSLPARLLFQLAQTVDVPAFSKLVFKTVHDKFGGHIEFLISGGAAIDNDVARDFKTLGFTLLTGYGMTEAAPMISFTRPGTLRIGASGQPLPGIEVKIVDDEIVARGRNIMQGYYHRPEETEEVLKDGWLHTGDLGYLDEDDFLFITGRKKEIIVLPNGKNINPEEIEFKILKQFDTVREIGVFMHEGLLQAIIYPDLPVLHERGVHQINQYVRWDIVDKYNHSVSPAKRITKFTVLKHELPRTRLGKLRRFQLPGLTEAAEKPKEPHREPEYEEYGMIKDFLEEQTGQSIHPEDHLDIDLGLDSLDKVSFQVFLQSTFGLDLQDEDLTRYLTVEKIADHVREKKVKMDVEGVNWHNILHESVEVELPGSSAVHIPGHRVLKWGAKHYFQLSVSGLEHVPDTPCILAANHQSFLDAFLLSSVFNAKLVKKSCFYADERHFRQAWKQKFAHTHNVIIMDINRNLKESLQKMAAVLKSGRNMVIFPEGSRTRDGELQEFKKTFAILSCELNVPIVPIVLHGVYAALPIGKKIPRFRQSISIDFLEPVWPGELSYDELTDAVYHRIKTHLEKTDGERIARKAL